MKNKIIYVGITALLFIITIYALTVSFKHKEQVYKQEIESLNEELDDLMDYNGKLLNTISRGNIVNPDSCALKIRALEIELDMKSAYIDFSDKYVQLVYKYADYKMGKDSLSVMYKTLYSDYKHKLDSLNTELWNVRGGI